MNLRQLPALFVLTVAMPAPAAPPLSENVIFHSRLDEHSQYADIWGYTDPGGDEYALICTSMGLAVINVTDRKNPYETGFLPGPTSTWRDVKTYSTYAYVTNETGSGLAIIDLTDPENPVALPRYNGFSSAHNLYIDTATARAYIAGSNLIAGGVRILSLANPTAPVQVGSWETAYFHDIYVQDDVLYGAALNVGLLYLLDVTNPGSVSVLGSVATPEDFTHNVWANAAGTHVMTTDEVNGAACRVWDVTNPASISQTDSYLPDPNTIPHNAHIEGDIAFISHYTLGVRIVDLSNPNSLQELGYYDTYPQDDAGTFRGCWGAYPFFPNSPDLIVASDFTEGLFVLEYKGELGTVTGTISGGPLDLSDAVVTIQETGNFDVTPLDGTGAYAIEDVPGSVTLEATAFGYLPATAGATITAGGTTLHDVTLTPVPGGRVFGSVSVPSGPVVDGTVEVLGTPVSRPVSGSPAGYGTDNLPVGTYSVEARAFGVNAERKSVNVQNGVQSAVIFSLVTAPIVEDVETSPTGWGVSGGASTGAWEVGIPQATSDFLGPVQTGADHTSGAGQCWVTGASGGSAGSNDIDGGATILTTPSYDLTGMTEPHVSYWRWYATGILFTPTTDFWVVEVSSNGGSSWTLLETTDLPAVEWVNVDVEISTLITPTSQVQFRFTAQDTGAGSITEAALDDFMIYEVVGGGATDAPSVAASAVMEMRLSNAFPNPVVRGAAATVALALPSRERITARIFDVAGRRVATVADAVLPAGRHRIEWDARDGSGSPVPAGVYFLRLEAGDQSFARKVNVLR